MRGCRAAQVLVFFFPTGVYDLLSLGGSSRAEALEVHYTYYAEPGRGSAFSIAPAHLIGISVGLRPN